MVQAEKSVVLKKKYLAFICIKNTRRATISAAQLTKIAVQTVRENGETNANILLTGSAFLVR